MDKDINNFIQSNSPDGGFLQSEEWRKFQESVGRKTYNIAGENFNASIVEHNLPIGGKYFYIPRGPIFNLQFSISKQFTIFNDQFKKIINLAKENNVGWIRIEPATENNFEEIKKTIKYKISKAPHDMQPKEILIMDISKPEEKLLAEMKSKTRYNIRLAEKKGVKIKIISNSFSCHPERAQQFEGSSESKVADSSTTLGMTNNYIDEFIRLVKITADRDKITPHPENYYRKMFEAIPEEVLKLYVAEYENKIIAANLVVFYGDVCTYLHGASDNNYRNVMAPYLLQWQAIKDAKLVGCTQYDFGGVNTKTGQGITKFKTGFALITSIVEFPGSYDIIINPVSYKLYRIMQKIKGYAK